MSGRRAQLADPNSSVPTGRMLIPELVDELLETAVNIGEDLAQIKHSLIGESEASESSDVIPPHSVYDRLCQLKKLMYEIQQDATRIRTFTVPSVVSAGVTVKAKAVR